MQNQVIVRIEGVGAFRMPAALAQRVLEEPRYYSEQFAGMPGTLPQESYARAPDVYLTNAAGVTFAPCGEDYCVWDYGNFPAVEVEECTPFGSGQPYPRGASTLHPHGCTCEACF